MDLNSVNSMVFGLKRSTPRCAEAQIMPLPSTSTVTAPPSGAMLSGVGYTSTLPVFGSTLPRLRRPGFTSNQMIALFVAGDAVSRSSAAGTVRTRNFPVGHLTGRLVDLADRDEAVGAVRREPRVAVEVHRAVMDQEAGLGRRAHCPVRAVIHGARRKEAGAGIGNALDIIELPDDAGGFTGRTRTLRRSSARRCSVHAPSRDRPRGASGSSA